MRNGKEVGISIFLITQRIIWKILYKKIKTNKFIHINKKCVLKYYNLYNVNN